MCAAKLVLRVLSTPTGEMDSGRTLRKAGQIESHFAVNAAIEAHSQAKEQAAEQARPAEADTDVVQGYPSQPGCYMRMPSRCPAKPMKTMLWRHDTWAEQHSLDAAGCKDRKSVWDKYCESDDAKMVYVKNEKEKKMKKDWALDLRRRGLSSESRFYKSWAPQILGKGRGSPTKRKLRVTKPRRSMRTTRTSVTSSRTSSSWRFALGGLA